VTETIGSELTLVDSSGWVAYLGDGPQAEAFGTYLEREDLLVVPTIVIYEVVKKLQLTASSVIVQRFLSHALRARVVELDVNLAIAAAEISIRQKLAMADAIIYATAESVSARLVTSDTDFRDLPRVIIP
jgi:predicted nucleic acid-binding protein